MTAETWGAIVIVAVFAAVLGAMCWNLVRAERRKKTDVMLWAEWRKREHAKCVRHEPPDEIGSLECDTVSPRPGPYFAALVEQKARERLTRDSGSD